MSLAMRGKDRGEMCCILWYISKGCNTCCNDHSGRLDATIVCQIEMKAFVMVGEECDGGLIHVWYNMLLEPASIFKKDFKRDWFLPGNIGKFAITIEAIASCRI